MSDANHEIREIAEELTELGLSYHPGFEKIFGPNNPFSNRWNLVLSFGQSVTGKEIYRHIKTDSDADTVELNRVIANGTEACKGLVDIFGGHDDYSLSNIRTGIDSGLLLFSAKSIEARNRPFSSVDVGRMMLVDIELSELFDFSTGKQLTLDDAQTAYNLCVTPSAHIIL